MTTMIERAARAAMTVCVGFNEEGDDVYVGFNTAEELARAVLMEVRDRWLEVYHSSKGNPLPTYEQAEGFPDMIDAILNERGGESET